MKNPTMFKIGIIESKDFCSRAQKHLETIGEVSFYNPSSNNLDSFIQDKEVIFVRLGYLFNEKLLRNAKKLKYICSPTTGLNHIDLNYVKKREIHIISLKGEVDFLDKITATSEHTVGLLISLLRYYKKIFNKKNIDPSERDTVKGYEINSSKIGIIGLGRIGSHLVNYFRVFGASVFYYDKDDSKDHPHATRYNSIQSLVESSDVIILSASYSQENIKMIDKKIIDKMKGKFFINISRGELIDEDYLLHCVRNDIFLGVAIDVFSDEQSIYSKKDEIIQLNSLDINFIYTPHIGGATLSSMKKTEYYISKKLESTIDGVI